MKSRPCISIIIPTLLEEKVLARMLDQFTPAIRSRYNLEIIVSDGGSNDATLEIARQRADIVLKAPSELKRNIANGRNLGAAVAQGEILMFFNADVIIKDVEKFFNSMAEIMTTDHVSAATCAVTIYPEEEKFLDRVFHSFYNGYFWLLNVSGMGMGRGECHVIRKSCFEQVGGYNTKLAAGEDYDLFLRLRRRGKICFIKDLTVFESPRRFRKYGYLRISLLWFLNALSVYLFRRSLVDEWRPVR